MTVPGFPSAPSLSEVVRRVKPGLVHVSTPSGSGSGFVVDPTGYVITNAHVAGEYSVVGLAFVDGRIGPGVVRGVDRELDLALISPGAAVSGLVALPFGDSDLLPVAEEVVALGYPLGDVLPGETTVTCGIISAKRERGLQTDPAINLGNSGGPLVDTRGRVVGVNTARIKRAGGSSVSGISIAVPVNLVKERLSFLAFGGLAHLGMSLDQPSFDDSSETDWFTHDVGRIGFSIDLPSGWTEYPSAGQTAVFRSAESSLEIGLGVVDADFDLAEWARLSRNRLVYQSRGWQGGRGVFSRQGPGSVGFSSYIGYCGDPGDGRSMLNCLRVMSVLASGSGSVHLLTLDFSVAENSGDDRAGLFQAVDSFLEGFRLWDAYGSARYGWSISIFPDWSVSRVDARSIMATGPDSEALLMVRVIELELLFQSKGGLCYGFQH